MKKVLTNNWPFFLILIFSQLTVWPLFLPGFFSHHDDLQVMRIFEMRKCLEDFQIPCRWVPDMGFGNGFPLFNYYGVLPYYIGAILSYVLGFIGAAKALFFIPLVLGGISMYLLAKEIGGKWTGLTAATLYLFAPYRSLDSYVRGAISESFALAIVPLVFYFGLKFRKKNSKFNSILFSAVVAAFFTTHNIMIMLFSPLLVLFLIYLKVGDKAANFKSVLLSLILGVGLSSFFLFPAFLEKNLVQTDTLTRFDLDFRVHFVTVGQLFLSRFWGYGASVLGSNDTISFQIGWPHWWLVGLGILLFLKKRTVLPLCLIVIFFFSAFMTHNKSAFIWEKIGILRYTQFPWRFLSISIFSASLIGGLVVAGLKEKWQKYAALIIFVLTVLLNFSYFKPDKFFYNLTDKEKLSGSLWDEQRKAAVSDYLPIGAYQPKEPAPNSPLILDGQTDIKNFIVKSNSFKFDANVKKSSKIQIPVFDFPNWQVYVDGRKISHNNDNLLKRIQFNLKEGSYNIEGRFEDTLIRSVANLLTVLSLAGLLFIFYRGKPKLL